MTERYERLGRALFGRVIGGGYPAGLVRDTARRRKAWYRDYVETIVRRDVRDLARIRSLDALPRLLALAAAHTGELLNVSDLAGSFALSRPTIQDYLALLQNIFLLETLPPWHSNRLRRLIRTPKLHMGDTGVACALIGHDAASLAADRPAFSHLLETFVFQELSRQASWHPDAITFHHFRDKDGDEVDIVLERGARAVAGVEVKASATVTAADFRGLRKLREAAGRRFTTGVVLHDGEVSARFGDGLFAVPIRALWDMSERVVT